MTNLADISIEDLRQALDSVENNAPAKRLFAAIAYKEGITQTELANWFDVERKTIYNWLTRLAAGDLETAVRNDSRTGRPRKLSSSQLNELEGVLLDSPRKSGYDEPAWTTSLIQDFIQNKFDIDYSRPSCRRLMKESGLIHYPPREAERELEKRGLGTQHEPDRRGHVWLPE